MSRSTRHGSFWPSATQRTLLEVALGPVDEAAARWRAVQPLDVTTLEPGSFGLLPLLYDRLSEVAPDEPQLPRLLGTFRNVWYRNQLLLDRLAVLLPLLRQRAHVEPLLFGGMSAALRWYPRLGLRPVPQLELIVEPGAAADVVKVAGYAGWRATWQTHSLTRLSDESRRVLVVHHGPPPAVVGPLGEEGLAALRGRALELDGVEGRPHVLDTIDELLSFCATGARTLPWPSCQWLADARLLLSSEGASPPVELLLARAHELRVIEPLRATLFYLADVLGTAGLDGYLKPLAGVRGDRRERVAFRLAGAPVGRLIGGTQLVADYLQASATEPLPRVLSRFPRHLQEAWQTTGHAETALVALRKSARLLRRSGRREIRPGRSRSGSLAEDVSRT